jgi:hypothetical protein
MTMPLPPRHLWILALQSLSKRTRLMVCLRALVLEAALSLDPKYAPYARETALCVDLAYDAMEGDILAEIEKASGETREALVRLLVRLRSRRAVLTAFTRLTSPAA